ncbi:glutamate--tRNA ligase [Patescibacteria group bacterium]|nr:glutamate--tRNA ligase [Patescibacteria group bacterium]
MVRVRIPPSPTGDPHIGTAYTSLFNFAFAKKNKGKFILRIEDTDRSRNVEGTEEKIIQSLKWLSLDWDEGPDIGGPFSPYKQSERLDIYKKYAKELVEENKAYYCDCSPERLKETRDKQQRAGGLPHYDRKCRNKSLKEKGNSVVRMAVPLEGSTTFKDEVRGEITFQNKEIDDQVLLKSDGFPTYHLASVVDDHLMKISHVIRAEEWLSSTPKHVLLYEAFGWEIPKFIHLPILRNPDKSKISKRKNPVSIIWYKEQGYLPQALLNFLANMGWSMPNNIEIFSMNEFIKEFSFERIDPTGPIFDIQKLDWMNGEYIRKTANRELVNLLTDFTKVEKRDIEKVLPLIKERMKKLSEFDGLTYYFFDEDIKFDIGIVVQKKKDESETKDVLEKMSKILSNVDWNKVAIEESIKKYQEEIGWSNIDLFQTIRGATTGSLATPPLFDTLEAIGKNKVVKRLKSSADKLSN